MNKRREAFLAKNPMLERFTKNTIIKNFAVSAEEFDELIKSGFIQENNRDICSNCYRAWKHEFENCMYCEEEEYTKEKGYYSYSS